MIELTLPSSLDPTLCPEGKHVCLMFTQYTPYTLKNDQVWDDKTKKEYADLVKFKISGVSDEWWQIFEIWI